MLSDPNNRFCSQRDGTLVNAPTRVRKCQNASKYHFQKKNVLYTFGPKNDLVSSRKNFWLCAYPRQCFKNKYKGTMDQETADAAAYAWQMLHVHTHQMAALFSVK